MKPIVVHPNSTSMDPAARKWLEGQLGGAFNDNAEIMIWTREAPRVPTEAERAEASLRLDKTIHEMAANTAHIPDEELYALIDEAIAYVRANP